MKTSHACFQLEPVVVSLEKLLPTKKLGPDIRESVRYRQVASSIPVVGVLEHVVVFPAKEPKGCYIVLDGHVRIDVLRNLGKTEVTCLLATDDETYTYNQHVNRLSPIQEHRMLKRALDEGVSADSIARTLNLNVETIISKQTRLLGICAEAIDLLKDKQIGTHALRYFKHVTPMRQLDMAEIMVSTGNYTASYARALAFATPEDQKVEDAKGKKLAAPEPIAKMENELEALEKDFRSLDRTYGRDTVFLTIVQGYLKKLLENPKVSRYLSQKHADYFTGFRTIVEATSLEG